MKARAVASRLLHERRNERVFCPAHGLLELAIPLGRGVVAFNALRRGDRLEPVKVPHQHLSVRMREARENEGRRERETAFDIPRLPLMAVFYRRRRRPQVPTPVGGEIDRRALGISRHAKHKGRFFASPVLARRARETLSGPGHARPHWARSATSLPCHCPSSALSPRRRS